MENDKQPLLKKFNLESKLTCNIYTHLGWGRGVLQVYNHRDFEVGNFMILAQHFFG